MNKLVAGINGGFPLTQEAWKFHQDATFEALKGLMSAYGVDQQTAVILSGCERSVSIGVVTVTEGFVSIGGEICFFPEQTYPVPVAPNTQEYFDKNITYDPAGLKAFETSGNQDTRQIVTAKVTLIDVIPVGATSYFEAKRLFELIREGVNIGDWLQFADYHNDYFHGPGLTPVDEFRKYFKNIDGFVHLAGASIVDDPAGADVTLCQLPVGYRPVYTLRCTYTYRSSDLSANFLKLEIRSNGDIIVIAAVNPFTVWLHELPVFKV